MEKDKYYLIKEDIMKKAAALFLVWILVLSMAACGGNGPMPPEGMENFPPEGMESSGLPFSRFQNIEPMVIYEENGIQVTADDICRVDNGSLQGGLQLTLQVTNNCGSSISANLEGIAGKTMTVNGISVPYHADGIGVEVGETQPLVVTMENWDLVERDINDLEEIAFPLCFMVLGENSSEMLETEVLHIPVKGAEGHSMTDRWERIKKISKKTHIPFIEEKDIWTEGDVHLSKAYIYNMGSSWRISLYYENVSDQYRRLYIRGQGFDDVLMGSVYNEQDTLMPGARGVYSLELNFLCNGEHADEFCNEQARSFSFYMITEDPDTGEILEKERISIELPGKKEFELDKGKTLYEDNSIRVAQLGTAEERDYGKALCMSLYNGLDQTLVTGEVRISLGDREVADGSMRGVIEPGTTGYLLLVLSNDVLQECGLSSAEDMEKLSLSFPVFTTDELLVENLYPDEETADLHCQVEVNR